MLCFPKSIIVIIFSGSFGVASPEGFELDKETLSKAAAQARAAGTGAVVESSTDAVKIATGASVMYTDTYVSMGDEAAKEKRLAAFGDSYRITEALMAHGSNAYFMHDMVSNCHKLSNNNQ